MEDGSTKCNSLPAETLNVPTPVISFLLLNLKNCLRCNVVMADVFGLKQVLKEIAGPLAAKSLFASYFLTVYDCCLLLSRSSTVAFYSLFYWKQLLLVDESSETLTKVK